MKSQLFRDYGNRNNEQIKLQKRLEKAKEEIQKATEDIENQEFSAKAGGGAIEVTVKGDKSLSKVKILDTALLKEIAEKGDTEALEELVLSAANAALSKVDEVTDKTMSKITEGLPGLDSAFKG